MQYAIGLGYHSLAQEHVSCHLPQLSRHLGWINMDQPSNQETQNHDIQEMEWPLFWATINQGPVNLGDTEVSNPAAIYVYIFGF